MQREAMGDKCLTARAREQQKVKAASRDDSIKWGEKANKWKHEG